MIHFSKRGMGNFGRLGAVDQGSYEHGDEKETEVTQKQGGELLGVATQIGGLFGMGGGAAGGGMCGACGSADEKAEEDKKKELVSKYPLRQCSSPPTPDCLAYNKKMTELQEQEFNSWKAAKDEAVGETMNPDERQKFGFVSQLAQKLKAAHPEAGDMTLSEIRKIYPDDFDKIYEQLKTQFPFLKAIDADTALAMSPSIAKMTLDELINKTSAISGMGAGPSRSSGMAAGVGIIALLGIGAAIFFGRKK